MFNIFIFYAILMQWVWVFWGFFVVFFGQNDYFYESIKKVTNFILKKEPKEAKITEFHICVGI